MNKMAKQMRLDKFLCEMGIGTRSQVKEELKKKLVTVNGETAAKPELKIDPDTDIVCYQGRRLVYREHDYYMLYKPAGCVTATQDRAEKTVMDYFPVDIRKGLFPAGRLDKDTEGLLLVTDDGELTHRLLSPKKHVPKTYYAVVQGKIDESMLPLFEAGLDIGDEKPTLPAKLEILKSGEESKILLTITEGRYHQVKRMVQAAGGKVIYLKRLSMGAIVLDEGLKPGSYRPLDEAEIASLKNEYV